MEGYGGRRIANEADAFVYNALEGLWRYTGHEGAARGRQDRIRLLHGGLAGSRGRGRK